jgi:hypothetical protein
MASDPFLLSLGFNKEEPEFDRIERAFLDKVKARIQLVQTSYDEKEVKESEQWLKDFHGQFFEYSLKWIVNQAKLYRSEKNHQDAPKLKQEARKVLSDLQQGIVDFASCYMHLNRYMTIIRDEIKSEEARGFLIVSKNSKWTSDTGVIITRYKKRKQKIKKQEENFENSKQILADIQLNEFKKSINDVFGKEKGDELYRRFLSALRVADFKKAQRVLKELAGTKTKFSVDKKNVQNNLRKILEKGKKTIEVLSSNKTLLEGEDERLFLKEEEMNVVRVANEKEVLKMNLFLAKYHLPYMQYKLDNLNHLRDKLLVIGSLESLLTLYKKVIVGIALPISDIKTLRLFENEALDRVNYLLDGHFQDVSVIRNRAEETVEEFRKNYEEFKDVEEFIMGDHGKIDPKILSQIAS